MIELQQLLHREPVFALLNGFNRFGPFGVSFGVSWICISVPFCALKCTFSSEGMIWPKKNGALEGPRCVGSTELVAERGRFELPKALRPCLISSQVHSTGLCHLSDPRYSFSLTATAQPWQSSVPPTNCVRKVVDSAPSPPSFASLRPRSSLSEALRPDPPRTSPKPSRFVPKRAVIPG